MLTPSECLNRMPLYFSHHSLPQCAYMNQPVVNPNTAPLEYPSHGITGLDQSHFHQRLLTQDWTDLIVFSAS